MLLESGSMTTHEFVKTDTVLDRILANTVQEVAARRKDIPLDQVMAAVKFALPPRNFTQALHRDTVALIAEVKHASPSKGVLIDPFDPVELGQTYAANGASAISVLTDEQFFRGHLDHLRAVRNMVSIPVLRKDFVVDAYQVYEGRVANADAMLLIVAALHDTQMAELHQLIVSMDMSVLVEVHNAPELERALAIGAKLIGINNRDLKSFAENLDTTAVLARLVPNDVTLVAESAIRTVEDVKRMGQVGAHAVLVGEGLVKAGNIASQVNEFSSQRREVRQ